MRFLKAVAVGAFTLVNLVVAQTKLAFTDVPGQITAGQLITVKYAAQDLSQPATIILRKGDPKNLDTISVLTSNAVNGTYLWIPSPSLVSASDYALEITQGDQVNYSGLLVLVGANPAAVSSAQAATSSSAAAAAALTASVSASSAVSSIQSVIASYNSSLANLIAPVTVTAPVTNATVVVTPSLGTGASMTRNATFSSPSLTSQSAQSSSAAAASTTTGSKSSTSKASASASSSSTTGAAATLEMASTPALALFCVAVIFFLQ